jgi:membrane protease YdiL (CAAX protease family)
MKIQPPKSEWPTWPLIFALFVLTFGFVRVVNRLLVINPSLSGSIPYGLLTIGLSIILTTISFVYIVMFTSLRRKEVLGTRLSSGPVGLSVGIGITLGISVGFIVHCLNPKLSLFSHISFFGLCTAASAALEELTFRGVLYALLRRHHSAKSTISLLVIISIALHYRGLNQPLIDFVLLCCVNIVAGYLRFRYSSVLAPLLFHVTYNLVVTSV